MGQRARHGRGVVHAGIINHDNQIDDPRAIASS